MMRELRRIAILFSFAAIVVPFVRCQTGIPPPINDDSFDRPKQGTIGRNTATGTTEMSRARTKGLCRDGWTQGTMRDVSGLDIPICLKINTRAQSWEEAKSTCRKDYGFLMKLDSIANWDDNELLSVLYEEGIKKTWTGVHTEHGRLVWDDLVPSQLKPNNARGNSNTMRPWRWDSKGVSLRSGYCGYVDINNDSNDRKKRSSDDDNTDGIRTFDLSSIQDALSDLTDRPPSPVFNYPRTAAFQSGLTRTQLSDKLPVLPSSSLGLQSVLQIPGTGLSDANTQDGGLSATLSPTFESVTQKDKEENADGMSDFGAHTNNIKDIENQVDSSNTAEEDTQSALDKLREHLNEMQNIQSDSSILESNPTISNTVGGAIESSDTTTKSSLPNEEISNFATGVSIDDKPASVADLTSDLLPDVLQEAVDKTVDGAGSDFTNVQIYDQTDIPTLAENEANKVDIVSDAIENLPTLTENEANKVDIVSDAIDNIQTRNENEANKVDIVSDVVDNIPTLIENEANKVDVVSDVIENVNAKQDETTDVNVASFDLQTPDIGENNETLPTLDSLPTNKVSTIPDAIDIVKDILDGKEDISETSIDLRGNDLAQREDNSATQGVGTAIPSLEVGQTTDKELNKEDSDEYADTGKLFTNDISQVEGGVDVPMTIPPVIFDDNDIDIEAPKNEIKIVEENDKSDSVVDITPQSNDVTTHSWRPYTSSDWETKENTTPWNDTIQDDDDSDDKADIKDDVTSSLKPDIFEMTTENPFLHDDIREHKDMIEDLTPSTLPSINIKMNEEGDWPDYESDKRNESNDDISERINDYLSQFTNHTEVVDTDDENDKNESKSDTHITENEIDDIRGGYEKFIKNMMGQSNDSVDDHDEESTKQDKMSQDDDEADSLIESIRDTQNAILGISDNDRDDDSNHNEADTIENNDFDYTFESPDSDMDIDSNYTEEVNNDAENDTPDTDDKIAHELDDEETENHNSLDNGIVGYENDEFDGRNDVDETDFEPDRVPITDFGEEELGDVNEDRAEVDDEDLDFKTDIEAEDDNDRKIGFTDGQTDMSDYEDHQENTEDDLLKSVKDGDDTVDDEEEDILEIQEEMQNPANLGEIVTKENKRVSRKLPHYESDMVIGSCETRLPSVCFSYAVEVMAKASTCDDGWYGHVLLDTCFKLTNHKMSYHQAVSKCRSLGARVVLGDTEFQRRFVLIAVQKDGQLHRGEKFWKESPVQQGNTCRYFSEREASVETTCNAAHRVVCIKDAKSLSVHDDLELATESSGSEVNVDFFSRQSTNTLVCDLTNTASEFPVLWFKDGVLVKTIDKYVTNDVSLHLDDNLMDIISRVAGRNITAPVLQGKYWCEVWDRKTLTRKRSTGYDVRFKDVISFHGSMELRGFSHKQEVLFNMVNQRFESLARTELDIQRVFKDVLPRLRRYSPDVQSVYTYADNVRSNPSVVEYHTYFTLSRDYTTDDEEVVYNRLKGLLRSQLGNLRYMASLEGGTPIQSFRTMSLQSTVSCPATSLQTTRDLFGKSIPSKTFSFPKVLLGEFANSLNNCSDRSRLPSGTARCLGDFHTGAYWGEVVANECTDESNIDDLNQEIWGTSPFSQKLSEMSETPVNKKNVEEVVQEMTHITDVAVKFTPSDINKIADILDHSTQIPNLSQTVGENVLKTVNKLFEMDDRETHMANLETKAANRILQSVDRFADNLDLEKKDNMRLVSDNVVVEIWDLQPNSRPVIGLAAETRVKNSPEEPFKAENIATVFNSSQLYDIDVDAAIELPKEVFTRQEKGESLGNRLTMVVYRKSKLFDAALRREGSGGKPRDQYFENLNSFIISASIAGKKIVGLTDKVRTIFKPLKESDNSRKCVWWDFMMNDFKGGWSSKGCRYDGKMNGRDVCLCDHLTNFAVLLDFYGQAKPIEDHHELSLSIITMIGLSLSILGLSLTIISYVFFRKLRQGRAQQTLFNLSLALLFSMMVFLIGIKQTHNHYICLTVAVLLHYFILVSFMWMLMEAMLQYLTFVKIFGTYITRFTMKTVLPAWGLPMIPVIAVLSVDYNLYKGGPDYCWMSLPAFYYAFTIPISLIILINVIIFFITIVSIFRRGKGLRSNQKKQKIAMTNLQAAFTSFILLGLTWIFGYLAISDARVTFQYIFTILNSLQGFFIFILFVVRKKKVRDQWYIICCKGSEKGRVSRSLSASNSIPSSCSSGSRNRRTKGERDRSDSTKTVQSTYSNSSIGYTNYGYETGFDQPFNRYDKRFFRQF